MTQLKAWIVAGCLLSGMALAGLVLGAQQPNHWPLRGNVFFLGFANGLYAVSAIAAMMALAGRGEANKEGIRMGLWGAAQAIAMGLGGFIGTVGVDLTRVLLGSAEASYAVVFAVEAITFVIAAALGWYVLDGETDNNRAMPRFADIAAQEVFDGR